MRVQTYTLYPIYTYYNVPQIVRVEVRKPERLIPIQGRH